MVVVGLTRIRIHFLSLYAAYTPTIESSTVRGPNALNTNTPTDASLCSNYAAEESSVVKQGRVEYSRVKQ